MKRIFLASACAAMSLALASCGGNAGKAKTAETDAATTKAENAVPEYTVVNNPTSISRISPRTRTATM